MKRDSVYLFLCGFFITNALLGELAGAKLIDIGPFTNTVGVIVWPIIFLSTDIINEYFGKDGVRRITFLTVGLISYSFIALTLMIAAPTSPVSSLSHDVYKAVFQQSNWVIVGSIIAFAISQLIDVTVFWYFRHRTGSKMLWLRATGSTAISQFFDTVVILAIGFWLPGKWDTDTFIKVCISNYTYKLIVAVAITPLIYAAHAIVDRYLGKKESEHLIEKTAEQN